MFETYENLHHLKISHYTVHDILVTGTTEEIHLNTLNEVFHCLKKAELRLKKSKCHFMLPSVAFLGHKIDARGLHPLTEKTKAIKDASKPRVIELLFEVSAKLVYNFSTLL